MTAPNVGIPSDEQYDDATDLGDEEFDLSELEEGSDNEDDDVGEEGPPAGEQPAGEEPQPTGKPGDKPRDPKTGRFAAAPGTAPASEEGAHAGTEQPGGGEIEGGERQEPPAQVPEFTFRGAKQDWTIPGSQVSKDWIHIPRATFEPELRKILGEVTEYRTTFRQRLGEAQAVKQKSEAFLKSIGADSYESAVAVVAASRQFQETFAKLVQDGPEAIAEWLDGFRENLPKLQAQAMERQRQKLIELAKAGKLSDDAPLLEQTEELEPLQDHHYEALRQEVPGIVRQLRDSDPELVTLLTDEDIQVLAEDFGEIIERLVDRAPQDAPEYGLDRGDIYYDRALMLKRMKRFANSVGKKRVAVDAATRAEEENRRRQGQGGGRQAPPTVSARGRETGRVEVPLLPKTRAELEEWEGLDINVQIASREQGKRSTGKGIWPSRQKA